MEKEQSGGNFQEEPEKEQSLKEERIRRIVMLYYSRPDVRKAIFEFSKNRECVPRYFEGFGKRPDSFNYDSDILELAKKGATSFHCSEELWKDPMEISTGMSEKEFDRIRTGWDLLIDVDSKYIDFSKIYAEILIEVLKSHGIKNLGVKFSGSKGWHIIVPWRAFPEEMSGKKTSEMFPEWPRRICQYLNSKISEKLRQRVLDISDSKKSAELTEIYCSKCNSPSLKKSLLFFKCPSCRAEMQNLGDAFERKRKIRCPNCQKELEITREEKIDFCSNCKIDSRKDPEFFKERVQSRHIDADIVLVSPRHLFRMPYSLHEKTSLASVVVSPEEISNFQLKDADPLKAQPKKFLPDSEPGEAAMLLRCSLEYMPPSVESIKVPAIEGEKRKYSDTPLINVNPSLYPPSIKKILQGMPSDGRKRALFILLSFFTSLKISPEEMKKQLEEWNKKNYNPLPQTYINSQISWYSKQKETKLPPNFDKQYYKDLGITPSEEEIKSKNPINYVKRKLFRK